MMDTSRVSKALIRLESYLTAMGEGAKFRVMDHRKAPPVGVKLAAALLRLGFTPEEIAAPGGIIWDHEPPLKERRWDEAAGDFDPPQHDPRFLQPLRKAASDAKTFGPGGEKRIHSRGSDISEPLRLDRISAKFRARLLAPKTPKAERPKSKWPSRPFQKARTK